MKADSSSVSHNLKTAKGHIERIIKMIEEDSYCIDISNQLLAVKGLIDKSNRMVIEGHMKSCILEAAKKGSDEEREAKIEELSELLKKLIK